MFILYPDHYHPGKFNVLGEYTGSILMQKYFFVSPGQFPAFLQRIDIFLKLTSLPDQFLSFSGETMETLGEK